MPTLESAERLIALINGPDGDTEARQAVWEAILCAVSQIRARNPNFSAFLGPEETTEVSRIFRCPPLETWKLFEILSVLAVLRKAEHVSDQHLYNLKGRATPFKYVKWGQPFSIATQPKMKGGKSGFLGLPDIAITRPGESPSEKNIFAVIECKCVQRIGAQLVRSEFAKAHDLGVRSYFIWSYFTPKESLVAGAKGLGIDLCGFGFDADTRLDRLKPDALLEFTADALEQSLANQLFAQRVIEVANNVSGKQIAIRQQ